jgi:AhpD family alkylhydroperoxidase
MARLPCIEEKDRPEHAQLIADIRAQRGGRLSHLYATLLNSPPVAAGWLHLLTAVRQQTKLPGNYRELVILQVAVLNGAHYEYKSHVPHALKEGITQQQIDALADWRNSAAFDERMRAVLAYGEAMTRDIEVPDPVFAAVHAFLDDQETTELTAVIAAYNLVSRFLIALKVGT